MKIELLHIAKHVHVQSHCSDKTETTKDEDDGDDNDGDDDDNDDNDNDDDDLT